MPRSAKPKLPSDLRDVAGRVAREFAERLFDAAVNRLSGAAALPATNRRTDVEITVAGIEECTPEYLGAALRGVFPPGVVRGQPVVLVLKTGRAVEHLVLMQFVVTLEIAAAVAVTECEAALAAMVDGRAFLGYAVKVVGTR